MKVLIAAVGGSLLYASVDDTEDLDTVLAIIKGWVKEGKVGSVADLMLREMSQEQLDEMADLPMDELSARKD